MTEHLHSTYVDGCYRCELNKDELRLGPLCRDCGVPLTKGNARQVTSGQTKPRFTGMCRPCESAAARERYVRRHPNARYYTDSRRIYPLRQRVTLRAGTSASRSQSGRTEDRA